MLKNGKRRIVLIGTIAALIALVPQTASAANLKTEGELEQIVLDAIPDQALEIYPGVAPIRATTIPLTVDQADADISVETSSTDKVNVVLGASKLVVTPKRAGTTYVKVTAAKAGYADAQQTFAIKVVSKTDSGGYDWDGYAKIGGSGYVTGTVFSEIEKNVLYAQTDIGGAYRYDFAKDEWIGLTDDATDHSSAYVADDPRGPGRGATFVVSIIPDPVKKGRVYMAVGGSQTNAAIMRSEDYGTTWKRFPIATPLNGNDGSNRSTGARLAVDPKNNNIVYLASQSTGLWKSTNAGQTFTRISDAGDLAVNYRPTFVAVDPNSPVDENGNSTRIIVGTIGAISNTPPAVGVDPMQQRPYKSVWVSQNGGADFLELAGQPTARPDRRYGGFVAEHLDWDWNGNLVVSYAEFGLNGFNGVGSNSNFALDGRVYRFNLNTGESTNITPDNVYTAEQPALTETDIANGQVMQRGGIGGISVDNQRPGVMVASSFHRHANYSEEVVWYSNDYGDTWKVIHSEVVGKKDLRGYGYIDKDNGWGAAVHWAFDIQLNPYDSNMALFTTGNGIWMTKDLKVADQPLTPDNQVVWGFWDDGLEETVIWNLYSPTKTQDYLYSTYADWGAMSWGKDTSVSPHNSIVNAESPANRVKYLDPAFDADGNPRYDLDENGNVQKYLKPGYFERWINTENLDYAGNKQNVMVLTPSGNYQNTNMSAGVISFDEGKTATPLAVPSGIAGQGPTNQSSPGWISISADANQVVWSVGSQAINNTYFTNTSLGADSAAVGSHDGRPIAAAEVRVQAKFGDRTAWTKSLFYNALGNPVTTGNAKIFSDKVDPNVFYGFSGVNFYVSTDKGVTFNAIVPTGQALPNVNWNTSQHSQGANKIQVDVYNPRSIWLASNNATAGLIHLTYDTATSTWISTKVSQGTNSTFQQVGEGLGVGDNSVPALYAAGVIADNSSYPALAPHYGVYRSFNGGSTWKRVNDDQHQFGDLRALSGDSRVLGRVYLGTGTRGIRVGQVDWITDKGTDDRDTKTTLSLTADVSEATELQAIHVTAELTDPFGDSLGDVTAGTVLTTKVESSTLSGTPSSPWVSLTYVITGKYTWTDSTGTHSVTSEPVRVEVYNVDALKPVITGTYASGHTLTAKVPAGWDVTFAWLRNGVPTGATGSTYALKGADAGTKISVRADLARAGGVEKFSTAISIPKITPKVTVKLSKSTVKTSQKEKFTVTVKATGVTSPTGKITIKYGTHTKTVTLHSANKGKITVTLPKLKKGTYYVHVTYLGDTHVAKKSAPSPAPKFKVK